MKSAYLYVLLFLVSCGPSKNPDGEIVARVDRETLFKKDLLFLVGREPSDPGAYSRAVNSWVEKKLFYRAALSIDLDKDHLLTKERDLFYENLLVSSFIRTQTKEKIKTTKKEVSDYYLKNKASFVRISDEAVVKHFTFSSSKAAKKIKKELKKKKPKLDMEELLSKQQVETKTVRKNGAGSNHMSFVFNGLVGDVLGPKEHNGNFHIFQILQKHKKGSYYGLEIVYDEIYQRLYKEKEVLLLRSVLDSLYFNTDVFISQAVLNQ
tara:strand:+ start:320 stop:1114 length:795 start_codon:yes stop_codon:yes gene_type:complete